MSIFCSVQWFRSAPNAWVSLEPPFQLMIDIVLDVCAREGVFVVLGFLGFGVNRE